MRTQLQKLKKSVSTKPERIFSEILKELHIPFRTKIKINGREIDFIIGKYAIEIDGHTQDGLKNHSLIQSGYTPLHFNNSEIFQDRLQIKKQIKKLWQEQIYSTK